MRLVCRLRPLALAVIGVLLGAALTASRSWAAQESSGIQSLGTSHPTEGGKPIPVFPDHRSRIRPEAMALRHAIQPIVTEAYLAHVDGDYAKALVAFKSFFEALVDRWPQSETLVAYRFHGRLPHQSSYEPLSTRRIIQLTLQNLQGYAQRAPMKGVDESVPKELCELLRTHFMNLTEEEPLAEVERKLALIETRATKRWKGDLKVLLEQVRQDAREHLRNFKREPYEATTRALLDSARDQREASWAAYLTIIAAQRHKALIHTVYALPDSQRQAVALFQDVLSSFPDVQFPIDDPVFDAQRGKPIAPYAHLALSRIYGNWLEGNTARPHKNLATRELEAILKHYDDPKLVLGDGTAVLGNAMASLLRIYGDTDKDRELASLIVTKYPNMKFAWQEWWLGETHPEALILLAKNEADQHKKLALLMRVLTDYPGVWTGKKGSDDGHPYDIVATNAILAMSGNDVGKFAVCKHIINAKTGPRPRRLAENTLRNLTLQHEAHKLFVKPSTFSMTWDGCTYNYFLDAEVIAEGEFRRWTEFAPHSLKWKMKLSTREDRLADLRQLTEPIPEQLTPLIDCYRDELSFYHELHERKEEFTKSWDISLLKRPIGGIDPTSVCAEVLKQISNSNSKGEKARLVQFEWHNAVNRAYRRKVCDPKKLWQSFLEALRIEKVPIGECGYAE